MPDELDEHLKKTSTEIIDLVTQTFTAASPQSFHERLQARTKRLRHLKYGVPIVGLVVAVVISTLALTSGSDPPTPAVDSLAGGRLVSEISRVAPESGTAYANAVQQAEAQFSEKLMTQLIDHNPSQNVTASPLGLSIALQMVIAGVDQSRTSSLEAGLGIQRLAPTQALLGWDALDNQIAKDAENSKIAFHNADSLWIQQRFSVEASYLETLKQYFGTGIGQVNFLQPESASNLINNWIGDNTGGKIENFTNAAQFTASSKIFLANALFFSAPWLIPFEYSALGPFTTSGGSSVTVPMMLSGQELLKAAITPSFTAVDLPYNGGKFDALIVEPKGAALKSFLVSHGVNAVASQLKPTMVTVQMPRFTSNESYDLVQTLENLGFGSLLSVDTAQLSGISQVPVAVSSVQQTTDLTVNEKGTSAASSSGIGIGVSSVPVTQVQINHPFLLLIRDTKSGAVLFASAIQDPSS